MKKLFIFPFLILLMQMVSAQSGEMIGVGVRLQIDSSRGNQMTKVIGLIPNAPAQAAGLQEGDLILKVNGQSAIDVELADVVNMIKGEEGSSVQLVIERKGATKNFSVLRKKYTYSASWFTTEEKGNEFCTALLLLMNDAPYDFIHTMDSIHFVVSKNRL